MLVGFSFHSQKTKESAPYLSILLNFLMGILSCVQGNPTTLATSKYSSILGRAFQMESWGQNFHEELFLIILHLFRKIRHNLCAGNLNFSNALAIKTCMLIIDLLQIGKIYRANDFLFEGFFNGLFICLKSYFLLTGSIDLSNLSLRT